MTIEIINHYISGNSELASKLKNMVFKKNENSRWSKINKLITKVTNEKTTNHYLNIFKEIINDLSFCCEYESRIKTPASINDELNYILSEEINLEKIEDFVGFRYWIKCETLDEYPLKMLEIISNILSIKELSLNVKRVKTLLFEDNPHQKINIYFTFENINFEVQIKNLMLKTALNKTIYPMWQGHIKKRFNSNNIPFYSFNLERDKFWDLICNAYSDSSFRITQKKFGCKCFKKCELRSQIKKINSKKIYFELEKLFSPLKIKINYVS